MPLIAHPSSTCDVCLEPYNYDNASSAAPHAIPCGHIFCKICLLACSPSNCPMCRKPFLPDRAKKLHIDRADSSSTSATSSASADGASDEDDKLAGLSSREVELLEKLAVQCGDDTPMDVLVDVLEEVDSWLLEQPQNEKLPLRNMLGAIRAHQRRKEEVNKEREEFQRRAKHWHMQEMRYQEEQDQAKAKEDDLQLMVEMTQSKLTSALSDFTRFREEMTRRTNTSNPLPRPPEPLARDRLPAFMQEYHPLISDLIPEDDGFPLPSPVPQPPEASSSRAGPSYDSAYRTTRGGASSSSFIIDDIPAPRSSSETIRNAPAPTGALGILFEGEDEDEQSYGHGSDRHSYESAETYVRAYAQGFRYGHGALTTSLQSSSSSAYPTDGPTTCSDVRSGGRNRDPSDANTSNSGRSDMSHRPATVLQSGGPTIISHANSSSSFENAREYLIRDTIVDPRAQVDPRSSGHRRTDTAPAFITSSPPLPPIPVEEASLNRNPSNSESVLNADISSITSSERLLRAPRISNRTSLTFSDGVSVRSRGSVQSVDSWGTLHTRSSIGSMNFLSFQRGNGIRPASMRSRTGSGVQNNSRHGSLESRDSINSDGGVQNNSRHGSLESRDSVNYSPISPTALRHSFMGINIIDEDGVVVTEPEDLPDPPRSSISEPTGTTRYPPGLRGIDPVRHRTTDGITPVPMSGSSSSGSSTVRAPSSQQLRLSSILLGDGHAADETVSRSFQPFIPPQSQQQGSRRPAVPDFDQVGPILRRLDSRAPIPGAAEVGEIQRSSRVIRERGVPIRRGAMRVDDSGAQLPATSSLTPPVLPPISTDTMNMSLNLFSPLASASDGALQPFFGRERARSSPTSRRPSARANSVGLVGDEAASGRASLDNNSLGLDLGPTFSVESLADVARPRQPQSQPAARPLNQYIYAPNPNAAAISLSRPPSSRAQHRSSSAAPDINGSRRL